MMNAMIVRVALERAPYEVHVGAGLLGETGRLVAEVLPPGRCAVITDSNVGPLYAARVKASLEESGFSVSVHVVPAGERSKSLAQVGELCEGLIAEGLDRKSSVVALGGGVVGDLAGFVAAIYYRGIPYVQVPTTIVSQVDSSVGGKTGVNAEGGKNLIGAFHQPRLVMADTETLSTLSPREYHEGFAEVVKHAAIRDFSLIDAEGDLPDLIARNVAIKAGIVAADEYETGDVRALLNFGHTIGHGIENAAGYGRYLHGEAISLGLVAACRLSVEKAGLDQGVCDRIVAALSSHGLPLVLPADVSTEAILAAMRRDKKFRGGAVRFVLLRGAGDAFVSEDVTGADIVREIERLRVA